MCMASVADLVKHHSEQIRRASPQPPSPTLARKSLAPTSPSPQPAQLPDMQDSEKNATTATDREEAPAADAVGEQHPHGTALGDIQEVDKSGEESALEEGEIQETADEKEARLQKDPDDKGDEPTSSSTPASAPTGDSPLAKILEALPTLPEKTQEVVRTNLERVAGYPRELPLSASWSASLSRSCTLTVLTSSVPQPSTSPTPRAPSPTPTPSRRKRTPRGSSRSSPAPPSRLSAASSRPSSALPRRGCRAPGSSAPASCPAMRTRERTALA